MKGETSAKEARHFSCHIARLGTKHDVTAHTTGSEVSDGTAQNSAVSRYGLIINPRCVTYHRFPAKDENFL